MRWCTGAGTGTGTGAGTRIALSHRADKGPRSIHLRIHVVAASGGAGAAVGCCAAGVSRCCCAEGTRRVSIA